MSVARRFELARWIQERFQVSVRRACRLAMLRHATWYWKSQARDTTALRMRIREIAYTRPRFGYVRIWIMLRREGWSDGRNRIHRLCRLDGLQVLLMYIEMQLLCPKRSENHASRRAPWAINYAEHLRLSFPN